MKRFLLLTFTIATMLIVSSCQKEYNPGFDLVDTDTTGTDTTGIDTSAITSSLMPMTTGSTWTYKDSGIYNANYTITAIADSMMLNGINFHKFHTVAPGGESDGYFGFKNHNLYSYSTGLSTGIQVTLLVINDTASAGYKWTYDMGDINSFPATENGTIAEKNITVTVAGKTYSHVVHSHFTISYDTPLGVLEAANYDMWFAPGIGLIKGTSYADFLGATAGSKSELLSYSIK